MRANHDFARPCMHVTADICVAPDCGTCMTSDRDHLPMEKNADAETVNKFASTLVELLGRADPDDCYSAMWTIDKLAVDESCCIALRKAGYIDRLVKLLIDEQEGIAAVKAAETLETIARIDDNKEAIRKAGGIGPLVFLLKDALANKRNKGVAYKGVAYKGPDCARQFAFTLARLASSNIANCHAIVELDGVEPFIALLEAPLLSAKSGWVDGVWTRLPDDDLTGRVLSTIINLTCRNSRCQDVIREKGGIAPLIALLAGEHAQRAAKALSNLAYDNSANRDAIRDAEGIAPLLALLERENSELSSHTVLNLADNMAAHALFHLTADNVANCIAVREMGGITPLVSGLIATPRLTAKVMKLMCTLSSLTEAADESACEIACEIREAGAIKPLVALLTGPDNVARQAAVTIADLAENDNESVVHILEADGIASLVPLLSCEHKRFANLAAAMALKAIASASISAELSDAIMRADGIKALVAMLRRDAVTARFAVTALVEITDAENSAISDAVCATDGIKPLVAMLRDGDRNDAALAMKVLVNVSRSGSNVTGNEIREADGIKDIVGALHIFQDACHALNVLASTGNANGNANCNAICLQGGAKALVKVLPTFKMVSETLGILARSSYSAHFVQTALDTVPTESLIPFPELMALQPKNAKREAPNEASDLKDAKRAKRDALDEALP